MSKAYSIGVREFRKVVALGRSVPSSVPALLVDGEWAADLPSDWAPEAARQAAERATAAAAGADLLALCGGDQDAYFMASQILEA
jgi:hypothetical protein